MDLERRSIDGFLRDGRRMALESERDARARSLSTEPACIAGHAEEWNDRTE